MIKPLSLKDNVLELLTKKNMEHVIAIGLDNTFKSLTGVSVCHAPTSMDIKKVITALVTPAETEEEELFLNRCKSLNVKLDLTMVDGSTYPLNSVKALNQLKNIKMNHVIPFYLETATKQFKMGSLDNAKQIMKDKMFLLEIVSVYGNKFSGLSQNCSISDSYLDLVTGEEHLISELEYDKVDYEQDNIEEKLSNKKPSQKAINVKKALTSIDFMNKIRGLHGDEFEDIQERVWEYEDYLESISFQDFEIAGTEQVERTPDEEESYQYAKVFYGLMTPERIKPDFQAVAYAERRGELFNPEQA